MTNKEKFIEQIKKEETYLLKQIALLEKENSKGAYDFSVENALNYQKNRLDFLTYVKPRLIEKKIDEIYLFLYLQLYSGIGNLKENPTDEKSLTVKAVATWMLRVMAEIEKGIR